MAVASSSTYDPKTLPASDRLPVAMADDTIIYRGSFVCVTLSDGLAREAQDTTTGTTASSEYKFMGVSIAKYDTNSTGNTTATPFAGTSNTYAVVDRKEMPLCYFPDGVAQTDVGKKCYARSAQTAKMAADSPTNFGVYIGNVALWVDSTHAYVDIAAGIAAAPA